MFLSSLSKIELTERPERETNKYSIYPFLLQQVPKMSATSSLADDEHGDLSKQIGCMNGIFQLFDRHHLSRRISGHGHKRMIQDVQHHQLEPYSASKTVLERGAEFQKEKPRTSTESSRTSNSSSCSSTLFSSIGSSRSLQTDTFPFRPINHPESPLQKAATKGKKPSQGKYTELHDIRDFIKDSMYREPRGLSIKSHTNEERKGIILKHIDSPRPPQQSNCTKTKASSFDGPPRVTKTKLREEQLACPRFSYDDRESREMLKSSTKQKVLPRLSLDSKTSYIDRSCPESRLTTLDTENVDSTQVVTPSQHCGSHGRASGVVVRLMGLEGFSDTISENEMISPRKNFSQKEVSLAKLSSAAEERMKNRPADSPCVSQNYLTLASSRLSSARSATKPTTCSKMSTEPVPWRQQGPVRATQSSRAAPGNTNTSSSVYGEIEKRISKLEFKRSGRDLRALKQILEAMHKTRQKFEEKNGCSLDERWPDNDSCSSMSNTTPKQLGTSSGSITKPAKVMVDIKLSNPTCIPGVKIAHPESLQIGSPKYNTVNPIYRQKTLPSRNMNLRKDSCHFSSTEKRTTWRVSNYDSTTADIQGMKAETYAATGHSSPSHSPRLQQSLVRISKKNSDMPSSDSGRLRKNCNKKLMEKGYLNSKHQVKDLSIVMRCQGETASLEPKSNNSLALGTKTEIICTVHSMNTASRQKKNSVPATREIMPAVEHTIIMSEQPSPISVLDDTFYKEDSPSPVQKMSTPFQDWLKDASPSSDEIEWHVGDLKHQTDCMRSDNARTYGLQLKSITLSANELRLLNSGTDKAASECYASVGRHLKPDQAYINKILLISGLLKDSSIISTCDLLLSSGHLINPEIFHVLEQTERVPEGLNKVVIQEKERVKLNNKVQRKIVFDLVDEILVRKITSGRLDIMAKKAISPHCMLTEVYSEVDRVCRINNRDLDDKEDEINRLLKGDMMHQSKEWGEISSILPSLVLDIERLIFKELINEVVMDICVCSHS